jgi:CRP/FNR family transcriptional regulator, cyclic AMP receptor protein
MVSPELLRRYPFFAFLDDARLRAVAMITEEVVAEPEEVLFREGTPADALYFLIDGGVELHYVVKDARSGAVQRDFLVGHVNPGEVLAISALIEPYTLTTDARTTTACRLLRIEAAGLRALCELDTYLAHGMMRAAARAAMERLGHTRVELVAARTT